MSEPVIEESKTVSLEAHEAVKADMFRFKQKLKEIEEERKLKEEAALKEKQEWKQLAELKEKEAESEREKNKSFVTTYVRGLKINAVKDECMKLGIRPEAIDDISGRNFDSLQVQQGHSGDYIVLGAKDEAERLKMLKPHWFGGQKAPRVSGGVPEAIDNGGSKVTLEDLKKAEKEADKTGDWAKAQDLYNKFKTQGG